MVCTIAHKSYIVNGRCGHRGCKLIFAFITVEGAMSLAMVERALVIGLARRACPRRVVCRQIWRLHHRLVVDVDAFIQQNLSMANFCKVNASRRRLAAHDGKACFALSRLEL